jgi:hypothetical protein
MRESVVPERLEWIFRELRRQILGTDDPRQVETELERLGAVACFHLEASIGALFGVELADRRRIALKVHQSGVAGRDLDAVQAAQSHLAAAGFPCPRPVLPPTPFLDRLATGEWRDEGAPMQTVDARRMRAPCCASSPTASSREARGTAAGTRGGSPASARTATRACSSSASLSPSSGTRWRGPSRSRTR